MKIDRYNINAYMFIFLLDLVCSRSRTCMDTSGVTVRGVCSSNSHTFFVAHQDIGRSLDLYREKKRQLKPQAKTSNEGFKESGTRGGKEAEAEGQD